jgi:adenylosuccinate lyase
MSDRYVSPLCRRYAGEHMQYIFSEQNKFSTWRRLWVALAESQMELGLPVTPEQVAEMKAHIDDIDFAAAERHERATRHDVFAHILTFGEQCPAAAPVIHLGATSAYVGDNTDIILLRDALRCVKESLLCAMEQLCGLAEKYKSLPCLAYTHFQPAQPTTAGKRAALWLQDLLMDLEQLDFALESLKFLGCKGATGTAASFLSLFGGDHDKVKELEASIAVKMGFTDIYHVSGQTYPRKADYYVLSALSGIAQSAQKFAGDVRLLAHTKEADEPFEPSQVGSSAMPYKRNPQRSERMAALARLVITAALNGALTAGSQWFERTLDDSANRRVAIPEAFLAIDAVLRLYINIAGGLTFYPRVMAKRLAEELPFLATENILMQCVKKGGSRQELHERLRRHCAATAAAIKNEGADNDLLERIAADGAFDITRGELDALLSADGFTGRAREQTEEFLLVVKYILQGYDYSSARAEITL